MYHFDYTAFKPDLTDCIEVLMSDVAMDKQSVSPPYLKNWCRENTRTYIWMEEVDTSDVSPECDFVCAFYFVDEADANWFKLRWL